MTGKNSNLTPRVENCHSQTPAPLGSGQVPMRKTSILLLAVLVAAAMGTAGCQSIPTDRQLGTFATATLLLADTARATLEASNAAVVKRKLRETAELGDAVDDTLFQPLVADHAYALRIEFLDALGRYATALEELASADRSKGMEKAVTKLGGALDALGKRYASLTGKKKPFGASGAIKGIVEVIGKEVTEAQRREGIRRAVEIQHTVMPELLPVLRDEVGPAGIFGIAHLNQAENEKATLMSRYNTDHKAGAPIQKSRQAAHAVAPHSGSVGPGRQPSKRCTGTCTRRSNSSSSPNRHSTTQRRGP